MTSAEERRSDRACETYFEIYDGEQWAVLREFNSGRLLRVSWPVIPAARLFRIWTDFGKMGVVRDEKGLENLTDRLVRNVARLRVTTELSGHTERDMRANLLDDGFKFTDKEWDKLMDFLVDANGGWLISDYGLPKLETHACSILSADTAEEKFYAADKLLQVAHQRSDLTAWFVQGGSQTLDRIKDYGTENNHKTYAN